ncbi:phosphoadenosine phosphosulfate reductase family protein [Alienimonas sp. DA493]|uniref:phosphoadenosine phosphosulfate reductase domain-containing protein n=1 Tax=Alienimonas sp. DA493 TaxID=3373605 RepID=UPI003754F1D6
MARRRQFQGGAVRNALGRIRAAADLAPDSPLIVAYSGGKDSAAVLDLAARAVGADRLRAYFCRLVPDLECQERVLRAAERKYGIKILRLPSPALADILHNGEHRGKRILTRRSCKQDDILRHVRKKTGGRMVLAGHRMDESPGRRGMISQASDTPVPDCRDIGFDPEKRQPAWPDCRGVCAKHGKAWPICDWVGRTVWGYVRTHNLPVLAMGDGDCTDVSIDSASLLWLRDNFPDDLGKVLDYFPFAEAEVVRDLLREPETHAAAVACDW